MDEALEVLCSRAAVLARSGDYDLGLAILKIGMTSRANHARYRAYFNEASKDALVKGVLRMRIISSGVQRPCMEMRMRSLLTPGAVPPEWVVKHFSRTREFYDVLTWTGNLEGRDREWLARHTYRGEHSRYYGLLPLLREAGLLTPECGVDWYMLHLDKNDVLDALVPSGLVKTLSADRLAEILPAEQLLKGLKAAEPTVVDFDRDWLAERLPRHELFDALTHFDLVLGSGHEWLAAKVPKSQLYAALEAAEAEYQTANWYKAHLPPKDLYAALDGAGVLETMDYDYIIENVPKADRLEALKESDTIFDMSPGDIVKYLPKKDRFEALVNARQLKPELGRDWYAEHLGSRADLFRALLLSGLLDGIEGGDDAMTWYHTHLSKEDAATVYYKRFVDTMDA